MEKFTLLFLLFSASVLHAQQWITRYNGTGNNMDEIKAMVVDNAGNVYVTGYSFSGANDNDYITIKYNTNGVQQWLARYNGTGNGSDVPAAIFVDNGGNVYVTGISDQLIGYFINNDVATVKYSPQGIQLWASRYDNVSLQRADAGTAVKADANGNVYVTGYTTVRNGAYSKKDYLTIKYNSSGTQQWIATYNGPANQDDAAVALSLDPSGNIYITGTSFAGADPNGEQDYLTIKYNPSGVQQWIARYNGPASEPDIPTALAVDQNGNVYVTGYSQGIGLDYATLKYNTNGVQQWVARYDGPAHSGDLSFAVAVDNAGNVYVTGTDQKVIYNGDFLTIKYNSAGVQQWAARFNGPANDNDGANALAIDGSGNVYVTGGINGSSPGWDIATVKYSSAGVQQWVKTYNSPKDSADVGNAIGVDGQGNVYVAGASTGKTGGYDFITLKYTAQDIQNTRLASPEITGNPSLKNIPLLTALSQNYPDPFKDITTIKFNVPQSRNGFTAQHVQLTIYNSIGVKIAEPVNKQLETGTYEVQIHAVDLKPGVYFYKLSSGTFVETKRMMVIR